jgi:hypothetical protein
MPADQASLIGTLRRLKWPLNKPNLVALVSMQRGGVDFSLSAEILSLIHRGLPGKLPEDYLELYEGGEGDESPEAPETGSKG